MADGNSGQKGIKNSLLSGATSTNFFEDAALLVPVPIVGTGAEGISQVNDKQVSLFKKI